MSWANVEEVIRVPAFRVVQEKTSGNADLIPEDMAVVSTGILFQIILMVFFRRIKLCGLGDLCHDGPLPLSRFVHRGLHPFSSLFLPLGCIENCRPILIADIVVLTIQCGGIMHTEETAACNDRCFPLGGDLIRPAVTNGASKLP